MEWLTREKTELESDLQDLLAQKQSLDVRLQETVKLHDENILKCRKQLLDVAGNPELSKNTAVDLVRRECGLTGFNCHNRVRRDFCLKKSVVG